VPRFPRPEAESRKVSSSPPCPQYAAFERVGDPPHPVLASINVEEETPLRLSPEEVEAVRDWQRARRHSRLSDSVWLRTYRISNASSEDVSDLRVRIRCDRPCAADDFLWATYELHPNDPERAPAVVHGQIFDAADFPVRTFGFPPMAGWSEVEISLAGSEYFVGRLNVEGGGMSYPGATAAPAAERLGPPGLGLASLIAFMLGTGFLAAAMASMLWSRRRRRAKGRADTAQPDGAERADDG
jgi:hypothetical protein